jgi:hypothetical protein
MTKEAEIEAWVRRRRRRIIHNQLLIQMSAILSIALPIPLTALVFWALFGLGSPIIIQSLVTLWVIATIIYAALSIYIKIKQRNL